MKNDPAFPEIFTTLKDEGSDTYSVGGLTKRELISAMALQGLLASPHRATTSEFAKGVIEYADALIAELEKE